MFSGNSAKEGRIGLLGGSFNPIHYGHLVQAEETRNAFELQKVIFIPCANPPHKNAARLLDATHRLRMTEIAVADNPYFQVSDYEIKKGYISYSIDTIKYFEGKHNSYCQYFIMGLDAFEEIRTWYKYEELFDHCDFIITSRGINSSPDRFLSVIDRDLKPLFNPNEAKDTGRYLSISGKNDHSIHFLPIIGIEISSTEIRKRLRSAVSIRYLTPTLVEKYLLDNELYIKGGK